ncbi:MAG: PfkB family carbohydrate kinase, partial [Clostridiales bacterium]|nr:PfkB family carbohydrate kinase [Clostridiales bacterium]
EAAAGHRLVRYALTNGEHPLVWYEEGQRGEVTPPAVEAIDTLGAGDVYHGAYCYFRYRLGLPFVEALTRAAEVAAKSVAYEGPRQGVIAYAGGNSTKHLDLP